MTDSPQSKVGPNPFGLWLPPKKRAQTSAHQKTNHTVCSRTQTGLEKVNRILSSSYLTEQQCSLFCKQDGIPVECFNEFTDFVLAHSDEIDEALATAFLHHQLQRHRGVQ